MESEKLDPSHVRRTEARDIIRLVTRPTPHRKLSSIFFILWLVSLPAYCLIRLLGPTPLLDLTTALVALSLFLFSLAHCAETRGLSRSLAMLGVAFAIALMMEYLGSAHGVLFGTYAYTSKLGPKAFGAVPVIIPAAWFMMLYPAWETAGLLLLGLNTAVQRSNVNLSHVFSSSFFRVLVAALAMTSWDLSLDPRMAADGAWIWHEGGPYFGIPLTNFVGWLVTSAMIYTVWAKLETTTVSVSKPKYLGLWTHRWQVTSSDSHCVSRSGRRDSGNSAGVSITNGYAGFSFAPTADIHKRAIRHHRPAVPGNNSRAVLFLPAFLVHASLPVMAYIVQWLGESMANALFWSGPLVAACVFVGMGLFAAPAAWWLLNRRTCRA